MRGRAPKITDNATIGVNDDPLDIQRCEQAGRSNVTVESIQAGHHSVLIRYAQEDVKLFEMY